MPLASNDVTKGARQAAREKAKKARTRRGQTIAVVSSAVVLGGLSALIFTSSGWPDVQETFFSAEAFRTSFPDILKAFWLDVKMFLVIEVVVLVLGLVIALVRSGRNPVFFPIRLIAAVYCDIFRGVPVILLIYMFGFGIPALGLSGVPNDPILLAGFALALAYGAYVAEVYRAGIGSVHQTQTDAALAVGLTRTQALRHVVLPQAIRRVRPPLLNDFISLQKDVALVSILGIVEAFQQAQIFAASTFNYTPLVAAALLYLAVTIPMARILDHITARGEVNA
ncbi:MAG: ABC transporter permease subunit [Solirubrobacterales bacterium]|nr:ABC transporter permease subunit [Solirubrobacterales bacterium]